MEVIKKKVKNHVKSCKLQTLFVSLHQLLEVRRQSDPNVTHNFRFRYNRLFLVKSARLIIPQGVADIFAAVVGTLFGGGSFYKHNN